MGSNKDVQLLGLLGKHGSYSFFKSIKMVGKTYGISSHFPVRIWPDSTLLSVAEIQLLWTDRNESFCSLKLYFLPENTPDGRRQHHGEDEVIALQDRVIIRVTDLLSWLVDETDWDWGYLTPPTASTKSPSTTISKAFLSEKFLKNDKEQMYNTDHGSSKIVVLNYERYIRLRTVLKRLEGSSELSNWLSHPLVLALGGLSVGPNCRLLFAKEVFDYPELEDHELLCNHLAPKLKGKPGKKRRRRRNPSDGSESNESESSSSGGSCGSEKTKKIPNGVVKRERLLDDGSKRAGENITDGFGRGPAAVGDMNDELVIKGENSRKLGKLDNLLANGRLRSGDHHVLRSSNQRHEEAALGASMINSVIAQSAREESESSMHVELLGPGLSELAQKLEKSNALQILPIRPSVIQKPDSIVDEEGHHALKKRLKTDPSVHMNAVAEAFRLPPGTDMEAFSRNWTAQFNRGLQSIYGAPPPLVRQSGSKGSRSSGSSNSKPEFHTPPVASLSKGSQSIPKVERPVLSITSIDIDGKKQPVTSIRLTSPSPFVPTAKIYGDPNTFRKGPNPTQNSSSSSARRTPAASPVIKIEETKSSSSSSTTSGSAGGDVLDFSVKRRRTEADKSQSVAAGGGGSSGSSGDLDLLDLSTKASTSSHGQNGNKNIFHSLADIPPPNAMNQLGLRLTSEVTLFPSNPPSSGHKDGRSTPKNQQASSHGAKTSSGAGGSGGGSINSNSKSASQWMPKQPLVQGGSGGNMYRSGSTTSSSSSLSSSSSKAHVNDKGYHGSQDSHSSGFNPVKNQQLPPPRQPTPQKSPKVQQSHRSEPAFSLMPATSVKDRHSVPGHSNSSSKTPVSHFSVERVEARDGRDKSREGSTSNRHSGGSSSSGSSGGNHGLMHPGIPQAFMPKIDPAYMHLFAPPAMFMPPPGMSLPGMLGMAPGAMEQLQFYKELLQHGLPPQFPGWPMETMKERGPK